MSKQSGKVSKDKHTHYDRIALQVFVGLTIGIILYNIFVGNYAPNTFVGTADTTDKIAAELQKIIGSNPVNVNMQ